MYSAAHMFLRTRAIVSGAVLFGGLLLSTGCGTTAIETARAQFYAGQFNAADATLSKEPDNGINRVLLLMERGTIRQAAGNYEPSAKDFDRANHEIEDMTAISVSQDSGSMVVNDNVQEYRGAPFERTLMHALDANNYLALGQWDDAAVEARRITKSLDPEVRKKYPEDVYSRYVAGLCFELANDSSAAAFEYRKASAIARGFHIDPQTGAFSASSNKPPARGSAGDTHEIVCLIAMGRSPRGEDLHNNFRSYDRAPHAEIYVGDRLLGHSYTLSDTADLAFTTEQIDAARKAVKTVARIAAKEVVAAQVEKNNELAGALIRLILIGILEQPDVRRWETLPRWLAVARVPCPPDLKEFDVVFKNSNGVAIGRRHITEPLRCKGRTYVSFCRDIAPR